MKINSRLLIALLALTLLAACGTRGDLVLPQKTGSTAQS